ncbi:MAG: Ig-like domain-containing protein [Elusimicrobiota bacterium]
MGLNNFYISSVTASLAAIDATSGVEAAFYRTKAMAEFIPYIQALGIGEGETTLEFYAKDKAGNQEATQSAKLRVDMSRPFSTIATLNAQKAAGAAQDNLSGIASVEITFQDLANQLYWNGSAFAATEPFWIAVSSGNSWEMTLPSLTSEHSYELRVRATDRAGWIEETPKKSLLDVTPPVSQILSLSPSDYMKTLLSVWGKASDIGAGVGEVQAQITRVADNFSLNDDGWGAEPAWLTAQGKESWKLAIPLGLNWTEGAYRVSSRAKDTYGNTETNPGSLNFFIDPKAPLSKVAIEGTMGAAGYFVSPARCHLTASDTLSGISKTYFRVDANAWESLSSSVTASWNLGFSDWQNYASAITVAATGNHTIEYYSMDKTGNVEESKKIEFKIDVTPAVSVITKPATGSALATLAAIKGSSSDEGSGLANVEISLRSQITELYLAPKEWQSQEAWLTADDQSLWSLALPLALEEGRYEARSRAKDKAGNIQISSGNVKFIIDRTAPQSQISLTGSAGDNGWFISAVQAVFSSSDNLSGVEAVFYRTKPTDEFGPYLQALTIGEGETTLEFYAKDKAGNQEATQSAKLRVDMSRPFSTIATLNAQKAAGAAQDNLSGIASVEITLQDLSTKFYWNGQGFADQEPAWIAIASSGSWEMTMPALVSGHSYELSARAKDEAGILQETPAKATMLYDATPPVSKISLPGAQSIARNLTTVLGTASDEESGVDKVDVQIIRLADAATLMGQNWQAGLFWQTAQGRQNWQIALATTTIWNQGQYRVVSRARDLHDNLEADPGSVAFTIDAEPPLTAIEIKGDLGGTSGFYISPVTLALKASDTLSGVERSSIRIDDKSWQILTGSFTLSASGRHLIKFFSEDKVGNVEASKNQAINIDRDPPALTILTPQDGATLITNGSLAITGRAWDALSGLDNLKLTIQTIRQGNSGQGKGQGAAKELPVNLAQDGSWTANTGPLKDDETYALTIEGADKAGNASTASSSFKASFPKGTARATIKIPYEGKRVRGNAVTIMAEATSGTTGVLFQFRADNDDVWKDVSSKDEKLPFSVYWNVSALPNGKYWLRSVAFDDAGLPDPAPIAIWLEVNDVNADVHEDGNPDVDPNNAHRKKETVEPDKTQEIVTADGTSALIPEGAVEQKDKITITAPDPADIAWKLPPAQSALKSAGVFREFTMESGEHEFQATITLTIPYPDKNNDGIVDGTDIKAEELKPLYFDEQKKEWKPVAASKNLDKPSTKVTTFGHEVVTHAGGAVQAKVDHFTLFGLFAVRVAQTASNVIAYPNPVITAQGMRTVTFEGLPSSGKIRIFTMAGRAVREIEVSADLTGKWIWDLANDEGEPVASGAYIFVVTDQTGHSSRGKLAVIR